MTALITIAAIWLALNIAVAVGLTVKPLPPRQPQINLPAHGWKKQRVRWQ